MHVSRREFLHGVAAAAAAPAILRAFQKKSRYPIAFSTLGCPKWPWTRVLEQAAALGYAAIELRGIEGEMDLTKRPEFAAGRIAQTLKDLEALDLKISDLGASARMHEADAKVRAAQLDEGKRFIDLAAQLRAPYVRVFPDKIAAGETLATTVPRIVDGLRALGEHARPAGVSVIMESHGDFTNTPALLEVFKGVAMPNVAFLWDAHHTVVAGKEDPAQTFKALGPWVRHTHLKDSKPEGTGVRYVLTGTGTVPVKQTVDVLVHGGYKGYYCYEWEKAWHPEIDEPEVAFPHYAETMSRYLSQAGVKPT
ncbi:MAG TPA: sugar phosphate isomerase/epimerase family protein [Vicinamibacterales bacterium]|nr:sugar phosphate isomerase/epimerase family protein [Vicinamibacterales bacterium]